MNRFLMVPEDLAGRVGASLDGLACHADATGEDKCLSADWHSVMRNQVWFLGECVHCNGSLSLNEKGDAVCCNDGCFASMNEVPKPKERLEVPATASIHCLAAIESSPDGFRCERHPFRVLPEHTLVREGTAYTVEGDPWQLFVSDDNWTIGDEKIMVALCPECSLGVYEITREGR